MIRRTSKEKYNCTLTQSVMRHLPKIHVWGCFISQGVRLLKIIHGNKNAAKYQEEILHDAHIVGKYLVYPELAFIFQYDLAPPHILRFIIFHAVRYTRLNILLINCDNKCLITFYNYI